MKHYAYTPENISIFKGKFSDQVKMYSLKIRSPNRVKRQKFDVVLNTCSKGNTISTSGTPK